MKSLKYILGAFLLLAVIVPAHAQKKDKSKRKKGKNKMEEVSQDMSNELDSVSYAYGMLIGANLKQQGLELNMDQVVAGLNADTTAKMTEIQANELVKTYFQAAAQAKAEADKANAAVEGEKNKAAGEAFLLENLKDKDVVGLPSGLQYKVIKEGTGAKPGPRDMVTVHYHGTLIDGTVFDSSVERGQPASFPVNGVIQGWIEGLQLMPEGSKWMLYIPSKLAYGARATGKIGAHSALIFEVELLKIKPTN